MITDEVKAQLGLPVTWEPGAVSWALAKLTPLNASEGGNQHVLVLDTSAGRIGIAWTDEELAPLVAKMTENLTGLVVASELDLGKLRHPSGGNGNGGLHSI